MKEKYANVVRDVSNIVLFILSTLLTVSLFSNFATKNGTFWGYVTSVGWITLGVTLESVKLYQIMLLKGVLKRISDEGFNWKYIPTIVMNGASYGGLVFVSIIASLGFCLLSLSSQSRSIDTIILSHEYEDQRLIELNEEIDRTNKAIDALDSQYSERETFSSWVAEEYEIRRKSLVDEKKKYEIERNSINDTIQKAKKDTPVVVEKALDVFDLLGEFFLQRKNQGSRMAITILMILIVILEVTLFLTSGTINYKYTDKEGMRNSIAKLETYINSLMDINGIRLNSDQKIAELTGLTSHECKQFKKMILATKWKGKPLITQGKGGSKANFPRENILAVMKNAINTEVED